MYVWIFENGVNAKTSTLTLFPENTQDFSFNQPHSLSTHSLATHLACVWLAGFRSLSLQGMSGQGWPAKKVGTCTEQKSTLCDPPHPPGDNAWGPPMLAAGSQASGLSAPTLLDGAPPAFSSTAKASLPAIAGRQAKKFCIKLDTVLKNPDTCILYLLFSWSDALVKGVEALPWSLLHHLYW